METDILCKEFQDQTLAPFLCNNWVRGLRNSLVAAWICDCRSAAQLLATRKFSRGLGNSSISSTEKTGHNQQWVCCRNRDPTTFGTIRSHWHFAQFFTFKAKRPHFRPGTLLHASSILKAWWIWNTLEGSGATWSILEHYGPFWKALAVEHSRSLF